MLLIFPHELFMPFVAIIIHTIQFYLASRLREQITFDGRFLDYVKGVLGWLAVWFWLDRNFNDVKVGENSWELINRGLYNKSEKSALPNYPIHDQSRIFPFSRVTFGFHIHPQQHVLFISPRFCSIIHPRRFPRNDRENSFSRVIAFYWPFGPGPDSSGNC